MSNIFTKIADLARAVAGKPPMPPKTAAIVLAAGSSTRMGGETPKQLMEIYGKPVMIHSLLAFEKADYISEIILVTPKGDEGDYRALAKEYGIKIALENMFQREVKRKILGADTCSHPAEFIRYLDTLDDEHFVACLDLGHCGVVGLEAQDCIRALGHERLHALHVHDNDYTKDMHMLPGLGKMDWEEIMKALAEIRYDGEFTYEADRFFISMPQEMMPNAVRLMVDMGRYLIGRFDEYTKELDAQN